MINLKQLSRDIIKLKKNKRKIVFTIGSTSKRGVISSNLTPIRETGRLSIFGLNFYNIDDIKKVINKIHSLVDYVFIDCEKKISKNLNVSEIINYFKTKNKKNIKKNLFYTYKANDLTVEAADKFLEKKCSDSFEGDKYVFGIIGAGNIGSKLALKINERGGKVYIFRRNFKSLKTITAALNLIKNRYVKKKILSSRSISDLAKKCNILISCSNYNKPIISEKLLTKCKDLKFILDVGKQSVMKNGITFAQKNSVDIYRLDISTSLISMIENYIKYDRTILKKVGRKKIKNISYVSGGYLGMKNDIIVNDINNIKKIYGLADGKGDFKKRFGNISLKRYLLNKLNREKKLSLSKN